MRLHTFLFIAGLIIFIVPLLGFPSSFEMVLNIIIGFLLMGVAISIRLGRGSSLESDDSNLNSNSNVADSQIVAAQIPESPADNASVESADYQFDHKDDSQPDNLDITNVTDSDDGSKE